MDKSLEKAVKDFANNELAEHALDRSNPCFAEQDWNNGTFDIQTWLKRTPWRSLKDTEFGYSNNLASPHPALWEDPLIAKIYKLDIATFLTAERLSVNGIASLVSQAPDEASQIFLATQTLDEARHYEVFCRRLADFGVTPDERNKMIDDVTTPEMQKFYDLISEQVDKKAFIPAILAHNIVLEGMAYPVYRYEMKYWSVLDPGLTQIIQGAFSDEVYHVTYGEALMRSYIAENSVNKNEINRLVNDFSRLMKDVFEAVIKHYIGVYQEAANEYIDIMGGIEIFPGKIIANLSEEDQTRILLSEIEKEHTNRLARIGLG